MIVIAFSNLKFVNRVESSSSTLANRNSGPYVKAKDRVVRNGESPEIIDIGMVGETI